MWRGKVETCEMCGMPIKGKPYKAIVDGAEMILCQRCYNKLIKSGRATPVYERKVVQVKKKVERFEGQLELQEGFGEIIKKGRESRGWTQQTLAQKLRISESMLKKIEQEKMKPSINLAKKIEQLLKVRILQPVEYEEMEEGSFHDKVTFGDVVVIRRDED